MKYMLLSLILIHTILEKNLSHEGIDKNVIFLISVSLIFRIFTINDSSLAFRIIKSNPEVTLKT